jgi:heavy metal sensor kinase
VTLTSRLTLVLLAVLAAVLAAYTAVLTRLAHNHLTRQQDERLDAAVATLTAAIEIRRTFVEWEPTQRRLTLGIDPGEDQPRWVIRDGSGRPVARSQNLAATSPAEVESGLTTADPGDGPEPATRQFDAATGAVWRVKVVRLRPLADVSSASPHPGDKPERFPELVIAVGLPTGPTDHTVAVLVEWSVGLSVGFWLLAAAVGRWIVRRGLAPVSRMAAAARAMSAADLNRRLPAPGSRDEVGDLAEAFNGLLARVDEAFARQARFTAEASHQLRTPLTALIGQADVALRKDRTAGEYRDALGRALDQGRSLERVIDALLFLARADSDAALPGRVPIDLGQWAEGRYSRPGIAVESPADRVIISAPPELIAQLVDNLVDNAVKFGDPVRTVAVRVTASPTDAVLEVEDHGPGLSDADRLRVFDPFFRSDDARRRGVPGVGLGLAVVKRIADALGAVVEVRSQPGGGTAFTLRMPRSTTDAPPSFRSTNPTVTQ